MRLGVGFRQFTNSLTYRLVFFLILYFYEKYKNTTPWTNVNLAGTNLIFTLEFERFFRIAKEILRIILPRRCYSGQSASMS